MSNYFAAKRYVIDYVLIYTSPNPYVIGLVLRSSGRIRNVDINHRERLSGHSGYTFRKLLGLWANAFTSFSEKPLRVATYTGILSAVLGFCYRDYIIVRRLLDSHVPLGYSSLMAAVLLVGELIMLMLSLVGEHLSRAYISINRSPQFVVRERCTLTDREKGTVNGNDP